VKPAEIKCTASSEYAERYSCEKAFDNDKGSAWASKGEGVGAWIQATFPRPVKIVKLKILQRRVPSEANKQISLTTSFGWSHTAMLPEKGDTQWNIITLPEPVTTSSVKITVKDVYGTINNGFKEIEIYEEQQKGVFTSPNHPGHYPNNFKKTEMIQVEQGMVVSLDFTAFNIEYHRTCRYDHLTVMDGDGTTLMEKSCGTSLPANIRSRSNIVKLSFGTDGSVTKSGWSVRWTAVASGEDGLFEGDMKLTKDQLDALKSGSLETHGDLGRVRASKPLQKHRNARINYLWPRNTVKFELASHLSGDEKTLVRTTLQNLQNKLNTCIRFVESSNGDRVFVTNLAKNNDTRCWSRVGHQGSTQMLNIAGCGMIPAKIEHEFLHAIGLYHTQSRSDRDKYVKIIWNNIPPNKQHNFNRYDSSVVNHFYLPYEFESVLHYGGNAFGIDGKTTIQTLDPTKQNVIGQRDGVSDGDIELVKRFYSCKAGIEGFKSIIEGNYVQSSPPPSNTWHYVSIRGKIGSENIFTWRNKAGVEWDLILVEDDWKSGVLKFQVGENCPYNTVEHGYTEARLFTNNGIEIEGPHGIYTKQCCDRIDVASKWTWLSGRYTKMTKTHNGKAVYQRSGDRFCVFFGGHWKIETCDWMEKGDNSQGLAFSKVVDEVCPERIGLQWRYFKWGVGGFSGFDGPTSQGPIDNGIKVTCN